MTFIIHIVLIYQWNVKLSNIMLSYYYVMWPKCNITIEEGNRCDINVALKCHIQLKHLNLDRWHYNVEGQVENVTS